jgi:hypothetical protein
LKLHFLTEHVGSQAIFPGINFILWPTAGPKKKVQNCVTLQWLSQTSCIFPVPAVVLEMHYFTPARLVLWPDVSHSTEIHMRSTGDPHGSQRVKSRLRWYWHIHLACNLMQLFIFIL